MKISAIKTFNFDKNVKTVLSNRTVPTQEESVDYFTKTTNSNIIPKSSFRGSPKVLNLGELTYASKITGKQAIKIFEKFKSGAYLDHNGGIKSYSDSYIRRNNLSFIDKIQDYSDKREFVEHYKSLTGFPNLSSVATKIKQEFKRAVNLTEAKLKDNSYYYDKRKYEVLDFGYDGISSVAKNKALPGSDLDKAFVLIKGAGAISYDHLYEDEDIVNEFNSTLWANTDQRILSYNHDADSFPKVYTEQQVANLTRAIDNTDQLSIIGRALPPLGIIEAAIRVLASDSHPSEKYTNDYIDANSYFIKLCKKFEKRGSWKLDSEDPSRENIYSFCYILEAMKRGEHFKDYYNYWVERLDAADKINVSQIYSLSKTPHSKDKYRQREYLERNFNNWDVDKQLRFIKGLMLSSCGEEVPEFPEYFKSTTADQFKALMRAVGL